MANAIEATLPGGALSSAVGRVRVILAFAKKNAIMNIQSMSSSVGRMTLRLSIENIDRLPDGGPLRVEVTGRGLDIGRDAHLDWTLPDPSRFVSGKHCEIRFRDGGYWLHDVSTNGTFVNGAQFRLDAPYLLRNGDRLTIGPYVVAVAVEGQAAAIAAAPRATAAQADVWGAVGEAAPPEDRSAYRAQKPQQSSADFLDFASSVVPSDPVADAFAIPAAADDWPRAPPAAEIVRPPPPPTAPTPRRPEPPSLLEPPSASPASELIARIAAAAGIPERAIAGRDPNALADEIGLTLRLTAQNLAQLLSSRAESKTLMRSSSRTMIRALENNPLKFTGSPDEALAIMFGPPTRNYLDARATIESSFADLKAHQILTFGAMQAALDALFEDLAPEKIDRSVEPERGLGGLVGSRKAKLWELYAERWRAKTKRADGRLLEAFMALFAEAYDRLQNKTS
jgi:type VI secretion system protein ImpI